MSKELDFLKQLRDITGAGILDCKKYLLKTNNDIDEAIKLMRSEEGIKADKKSGRIAAEGVIYFYSNTEKSLLIEINSETDFVARSDDFLDYVINLCKFLATTKYKNLTILHESNDQQVLDNLENERKKIITKLGENIKIRRYQIFNHNEFFITGYTHNNKIGAVVMLEKENNEIAKDICMQIVASNPVALDEQSIDPSILSNEKEVYKAELDKINKKEDIKRNILEGKVKKFISDNTLINQPYIKDNATTLKKILKDNKIKSYLRYQLGEGIDKKEEDFAQEVYSQIK
ncbi:MAG: translation elongation factor Ts [Gammaproteobacteria bacterium]|jgi:elongation factor Ts|nr:translation elongation factor Ts [Gammaproteobacteria bacterium]|tara:strand:+ start:10253 stop:11119 length:867 start_codon:yes stop_codon:yes gene_type:complete